MKLILATDHNGVDFKLKLIELLKDEYEILDASTDNYDFDDYPDFAFRAAHLVQKEPDSFGVLICGTGVGMTIAANKVRGIRCALVTSARVARLARRDDDANMIAIDSIMEPGFAAECIRIFTSTEFCTTEERYDRRKKKVIDYENGEYNEL